MARPRLVGVRKLSLGELNNGGGGLASRRQMEAAGSKLVVIADKASPCVGLALE